MKKQQLTIERELQSNSASIIWGLISSEGGLRKWLADEVDATPGGFRFTWGEPWSHHETREATVEEKVKNSFIRMRWNDEDDPEAFLELRMVHCDLTNDYHLHVTDYALPEDIDSLRDIWEHNFELLHRSSGL